MITSNPATGADPVASSTGSTPERAVSWWPSTALPGGSWPSAFRASKQRATAVSYRSDFVGMIVEPFIEDIRMGRGTDPEPSRPRS